MIPSHTGGKTPVTSASLALEVESKLRSRHICANPAAAARLCMEVVLPHLKALAAENERLRGLLKVKRGSEGEERDVR